MRMVVSLGDFDDSRWINLSGASGHAFHPHFTDQTDLYVDGQTLRWSFTEQAVKPTARTRSPSPPPPPTDPPSG